MSERVEIQSNETEDVHPSSLIVETLAKGQTFISIIGLGLGFGIGFGLYSVRKANFPFLVSPVSVYTAVALNSISFDYYQFTTLIIRCCYYFNTFQKDFIKKKKIFVV